MLFGMIWINISCRLFRYAATYSHHWIACTARVRLWAQAGRHGTKRLGWEVKKVQLGIVGGRWVWQRREQRERWKNELKWNLYTLHATLHCDMLYKPKYAIYLFHRYRSGPFLINAGTSRKDWVESRLYNNNDNHIKC